MRLVLINWLKPGTSFIKTNTKQYISQLTIPLLRITYFKFDETEAMDPYLPSIKQYRKIDMFIKYKFTLDIRRCDISTNQNTPHPSHYL